MDSKLLKVSEMEHAWLKELATRRLQGAHGVSLKSRKQGAKTIKRTFLVKDLVDWYLNTKSEL